MQDLMNAARKYALDNARKHEGKAQQGPVIGALINDFPDIKKRLKEIGKDIRKTIDEVNKLNPQQQVIELQKIAPEMLEKKKTVEVKELKPLPEVKNTVVMRIAPSPSGPLHIAHAFLISLNSQYCKMYNGKFILRIDDTDPENIFLPAYDMIKEDADWLTENGVDEVICQSDRMDAYYKHAEKMVEKGAAYVCTCDSDTFRTQISKKHACPCRKLAVNEHKARWQSMFSGYQPGEAVLRIKTSVEDPNPALRDWPAFRINDHEHARHGTEYRVWPLMNFAVAIDDHETGITHTLRGMDHYDNERRQAQICEFFKWKKPVAVFFGRINFQGFDLSKTGTRKKVEYGEYSGWDDIRLATLKALRRRGYQPAAFQRFALEIGINKTSKTVPREEFFKLLDAFNRDIIDPGANRYFFVAEPKEIEIEGAKEKECKIPLYPDKKERGTRKIKSGKKFLITKQDFNKLKTNKLYRLMECLNFKKKGTKFIFESEDYDSYRGKGELIIHWLPPNECADAQVLMPDGKTIHGKAEKGLTKLDEGTIVQLERFGFARIDRKKPLTFWYTHR